MQFLIALTALSIGFDIFSGFMRRGAERKAAEASRRLIQAESTETARKLKVEEGNVLSQLTARAGRAGIESSSTTFTPKEPTPMPDPNAPKPGPKLPPFIFEEVRKIDETLAVPSFQGAGSTLMQQQAVSDIYEQQIAYTYDLAKRQKEGIALEEQYKDSMMGWGMIGSILEGGSNLYAAYYQYQRTDIAGGYNNPPWDY